VRYEQKAWTGVVVMVGSGMVVSGIPRLRRSLVQRWERPDRYYERAQAQALLEAYNRDLARGLGESDAADPQGSEQREQP
jgi:hypothetical protein